MTISLDASERIGSGHMMRCLSIADAARAQGIQVHFVVSSLYAEKVIRTRGYEVVKTKRNERSYSSLDAKQLGHIARGHNASLILVDSYAVNNSFFSELKREARREKIFYIDDYYTFNEGYQNAPLKWPVHGLINYSFGVSAENYDESRAYSDVVLLAGPQYAPVSSRFRGLRYSVADTVNSILITSGSTNPKGILERIYQGVQTVFPDVDIWVVVGPKATFHLDGGTTERMHILHNVQDMPSLMQRMDIAIAAGGTTLYELAAIGVPTVAVPAVDNQLLNIRGFEKMKLGIIVKTAQPSATEIQEAVSKLVLRADLRKQFSNKMRSSVSGDGSELIVQGMLDSLC